MSDLVEFVSARITEDAAVATVEMDRRDVVLLGAFAPSRILADCENKRRIVTEYVATVIEGSDLDQLDRVALACYKGGLGFALRALATSYAAHPDFQEEWRV